MNRVWILYSSYLGVSIVAWIFNKFVFGNEAAIKISEFSQRFGSVITTQETFSTLFLKSFILIFAVYSFIIVIQSLSREIVGAFLYLIFALLVGLASGAGFGGGLITYLQGSGVLFFMASQLEWLAGAVIITSVPAFSKIQSRELLIALIMLLFSIFFNSFILTSKF